jgi:superfamily II DNA/RNA helicase
LLIGGTNSEVEIEDIKIKGSNILIGTPGKIKEIFYHKNSVDLFYFQKFEILTLDEADRLLENEFWDDLRLILEKIPKQRRTGLFSATLNSNKISDFLKVGLRNPVVISLKVNDIPNKIECFRKI